MIAIFFNKRFCSVVMKKLMKKPQKKQIWKHLLFIDSLVNLNAEDIMRNKTNTTVYLVFTSIGCLLDQLIWFLM